MTSPGGVGAARGDAPTPQDAATTELLDAWAWVDEYIAADLARVLAAGPVPVAADVPTPSAATQNDEAQR